MNLLIIAVFIAAAVILCGYTTVRLPVRREERKRHIACVGDSVTYGCTLPLFFLRRYLRHPKDKKPDYVLIKCGP